MSDKTKVQGTIKIVMSNEQLAFLDNLTTSPYKREVIAEAEASELVEVTSDSGVDYLKVIINGKDVAVLPEEFEASLPTDGVIELIKKTALRAIEFEGNIVPKGDIQVRWREQDM